MVQKSRAQKTYTFILADGSLRTPDGRRGSIHKLGALLANTPACNGWTCWYYQDEQGSLVLIDALLEKIRQAMKQQNQNP